jgi:hypothetical protein
MSKSRSNVTMECFEGGPENVPLGFRAIKPLDVSFACAMIW